VSYKSQGLAAEQLLAPDVHWTESQLASRFLIELFVIKSSRMTLPGSWVSAADFFIKFHASNTLLNSVEYTITRKDSFLVQKSCLNTATVVYPKQHYQKVVSSCEAEFLEKIRMKVLRVFFLVIHSQLYSFA
jgi:hypothetical protein